MSRRFCEKPTRSSSAALQQRYEQTLAAGGVALPPSEIFCSPDELRTARAPAIAASASGRTRSASSEQRRFFVKVQPSAKFHGRIKEMAEAVRRVA